ncbi:MAG: MarR family transcriptional regulator [Bacteroidetes bacterium]|nr:MarR family transcriptional regulator [Bacteroidota bacterium]
MKEETGSNIDLIIENLFSIKPLLSKDYTKVIRNKSNHTHGTLLVLGTLHNYGKLSMSEIGCYLAVPKPTVTTLVDRLIADDLVERLNDPADRRIIYIQITKKGMDDYNSIKKEISLEMKERLQLLSKENLSILSTASQQVKEILILIPSDPCHPCNPSTENLNKK